MDLLQREKKIDLQSMTKEQIENLIKNVNKEIELARAELKSKMDRILTPIGIRFAIVLKLAGSQEEIDEFIALMREGEQKSGVKTMEEKVEVSLNSVQPKKKRGRKPKK